LLRPLGNLGLDELRIAQAFLGEPVKVTLMPFNGKLLQFGLVFGSEMKYQVGERPRCGVRVKPAQ